MTKTIKIDDGHPLVYQRTNSHGTRFVFSQDMFEQLQYFRSSLFDGELKTKNIKPIKPSKSINTKTGYGE